MFAASWSWWRAIMGRRKLKRDRERVICTRDLNYIGLRNSLLNIIIYEWTLYNYNSINPDNKHVLPIRTQAYYSFFLWTKENTLYSCSLCLFVNLSSMVKADEKRGSAIMCLYKLSVYIMRSPIHNSILLLNVILNGLPYI